MQLHIKVVQAILTNDTDMLTNMDPYCVIKIGSDKKRTQTKRQAGKKPIWNQVLAFHNFKGDSLEVTVMDQDKFKDDTVGSGKLQLSKFMNSSQQFKQYVPLSYKGRPAGKIYLKIKNGKQCSSWNNNEVSDWNNNYSGSENQNNGWGTNNQNQNKGLGSNNNGWGNINTNNNSEWGTNNSNNSGWGNNNSNNSGWGNNNNQSENNQLPIHPQHRSKFMDAIQKMSGKNEQNSGW